MPRLYLTVLAVAATLIVPAAAQQPAPQRVEIVLSNFKFAPFEIRLKAGQPVLIHLVNQGSGGHNFAAAGFLASAAMTADQRKSIASGTIELKKGESRDLLLTPVRGSFPIRCTHFLHAGFGMTGTIVVE